MNPAVLDAFALVILGAAEGPAYPGVAGHEPAARRRARKRRRSRVRWPRSASSFPSRPPTSRRATSSSRDWQQAFWGQNYPRLLAVKDKYDPDGLFFVHHGVGSERWSDDGFTRRA